jgi:hypothetical protein
LEYCVGIGLPLRNSYFLANFASKLHHTLPHSKPFTNDDILVGLQKTMAYYRTTKNSTFDPAKSDKSVSEIEAIIEAKQKEYIEICKRKARFDKKAQRRAKALLALGSSIVIG